MPLPAFILPALAGAAMGAGRTFLDRNRQKDPWSYLSNGVQGAVGGAFGGLPGAFQSGAMGVGGGSVMGSIGNMIGQEFLPRKQYNPDPGFALRPRDPFGGF